MKYLVAILITLHFTGCDSSSQQNEESYIDSSVTPTPIKESIFDSMGKYSYRLQTPVFGNPNRTLYATGFFIVDNSDTFFISNYHVFTGSDVTFKRRSPEVGYELRVFSKPNSKSYYGINIKEIVTTSPFILFNETPDIYAYKCKNIPSDFLFYSIEKFIPKKKLNLKDSLPISFAGYPIVRSTNIATHTPVTIKGILYKPNEMVFNFHEPLTNNDIVIKNNIREIPTGMAGMSGSPVFCDYNGSIQFLGVYSMSYPDFNMGMFVRWGNIAEYLH